MKSGVPVAAVFVGKARTKVCVTNGCSELRIIGSFLNPSENPHGKDQKMRPVTTKAGTLISGSREKILWRPERKLVPQNTRKHLTDTELQGFRVKRAQKGLYNYTMFPSGKVLRTAKVFFESWDFCTDVFSFCSCQWMEGTLSFRPSAKA